MRLSKNLYYWSVVYNSSTSFLMYSTFNCLLFFFTSAFGTSCILVKCTTWWSSNYAPKWYVCYIFLCRNVKYTTVLVCCSLETLQCIDFNLINNLSWIKITYTCLVGSTHNSLISIILLFVMVNNLWLEIYFDESSYRYSDESNICWATR